MLGNIACSFPVLNVLVFLIELHERFALRNWTARWRTDAERASRSISHPGSFSVKEETGAPDNAICVVPFTFWVRRMTGLNLTTKKPRLQSQSGLPEDCQLKQSAKRGRQSVSYIRLLNQFSTRRTRPLQYCGLLGGEGPSVRRAARSCNSHSRLCAAKVVHHRKSDAQL